ncbi:MAG: carboxylesterase/lipase family protein [Parvibaculum sp.]|uniref:carboxylesterase/lipase family protein n=1 Tax=Parvibaculum sp. TaxID=2024848 RepID=UPI003C77A3EF
MAIALTTYGRVDGTLEDGIHVFYAIPYAAAPVGKLRFQPPQPHAPWVYTRRAHDRGPVAPQLPDVFYEAYGGQICARSNEDCLHLNIWTPALDDKRRPVMFWIHGGSFLIGSGSEPDYNGAKLARDGDVVVVTINYRLGALGFLHLANLGEEGFAQSSNHGHRDQIAALKWVRDNIAGFGGDPELITVFGESAGAVSTQNLMVSPYSNKLFKRAIPMSGPALAVGQVTATNIAKRFLEIAGVKTAAEAQVLPLDAILRAQADLLIEHSETVLGDSLFFPTMDGDVIPEDPLELLRRGVAADIDLMIGVTHDEARYWLLYYPEVMSLSESDLDAWAARTFGEHAPRILKTYRAMPGEKTPAQVMAAIVGGVCFNWAVGHSVIAQSRFQANTWLYRFDVQSDVADGFYGAPHAGELPFCFGTIDAGMGGWYDKTDPAVLRSINRSFSKSLLAFARSGNPNNNDIPRWEPFEPRSGRALLFDRENSSAGHVFQDEWKLWDETIGAAGRDRLTAYFQLPNAPGFKVMGVNWPEQTSGTDE